MSENHNANATLDAIKGEVLNALENAKGAGLDTLRSFRDIGRGLAEAKELIGPTPKGAFGKWCEENFPFSKQWRARLMQLAAEWKAVEAAMAWAQGLGRVLGRKEYSVDGALALVAEWIKADPAGAEALGLGERVQAEEEKAAKAQERAREKADRAQAEETEAEALRRMLAEALERIKALEEENARLRGGPKAKGKAQAEEKAKAQGPEVDKATKARAGKVYGLAVKGATKGERDAARARLAEMAAKVGADVAAFLAACGLDVAAYAEAEAADAQAQEEKVTA